MRIGTGVSHCWRWCSALVTAGLLGCSEDAIGPRPVPTAITIAAGEFQTGTVGLPLDTALTVFVTDKFGDPVPGVLVRFEASRGSGRLETLTQTTGPNGHAQSTWSLPTSAGTYTAIAAAAGLDSLTFRATALPAAPASLTLVEGDSQVAVAATALSRPVVVIVHDGYGNPVYGANVTFQVASGAGTVVPEAVRSDTIGRANATWTLGTEPGLQALAARVDSLRPLRIHAKALGRPTAALLGVTGFMGMGMGGGDPAMPESGAEAPRSLSNPSLSLGCWRNALGVTEVGAFPGEVARMMCGEEPEF
jgi:hypothetical protein